ncbi:MAG: histidinol-phosphatase HisJ family protein [Ruminococcaceae bacterium]|nr:histidinol-phosphatase HisJ family protein [Oscillospiraceae bacterium]
MFFYPQNLHTHTIHCDGIDTPEEMVLKAIELGFDTIGFSSHSPSPRPSVIQTKLAPYKLEINALKEKYRDRIRILCGIEFEMYSVCDIDGYDYKIGSVHYLKLGNAFGGVDSDAKNVENIIQNYFDGDGIRYAKAYYETLTHLHEYGDFDIVGHFDLVTKHSEKHNFFDTTSLEYRNAALESLHAVAEHFSVFELNTGAISRGYRTTPYPDTFLLKEMKELGCSIIISSDCHNKNYLDCCFGDSVALLQSCGFDEVSVLTPDGFKGIKI